MLYSSFTIAYVNPKTQVVRFENDKGWYDEATLTEDLAFWILTQGMKIVYEKGEA